MSLKAEYIKPYGKPILTMTETVIDYRHFDPFNHGTAEIGYKEVVPSTHRLAANVARQGWGLDAVSVVQVAEAEAKSNNFRVTLNDGTLVMIRRNIYQNDPETQALFNGVFNFCNRNGAPTVSARPSGDNLYFVYDDEVYCCYDFIDGEHYNGSREELKEMAKGTARLHAAFERLPNRDEIKAGIKDEKVGGTFETHNWKRLDRLAEYIKGVDARTATDHDLHAQSVIDELLLWSRAICPRDPSGEVHNTVFEGLPHQIIHNDLHPHNVLYYREGHEKAGKLASIYDLDHLIYSQRIRDVAFAMHRFARTYGTGTDEEHDTGADIRDRARLFLEMYNAYASNPLTAEEIAAIPAVIADIALYKATDFALHYLYDRGDDTFMYDLDKQLQTMRESILFAEQFALSLPQWN